MSDELDIRLKATLEADEAASITQIKSQIPSIERGLKSSKIKVPVEADVSDITHSVQESVKAATGSLKAGVGSQKVVIPIDAAFNIKLQDTNAVAAEAKKLIEKLNLNKGPLIDFKIKTEGVKEANSILLTYKNSAEETIKTMLKLVDVTTDLNNPEFQWQITSTEFEKNLQKYEKGLSAIKEAERKQSGKYWQGQRADTIKSMTSTSDEILKMRDYYKELESVTKKAEGLRSVAAANKKLDLNFADYDSALVANDLQKASAAYEKLNQQYESFKINSKQDFANNAIEKLPSQILEANEALSKLISRFTILQTKGAEVPTATFDQLKNLSAELQSISSGTMDVGAVTRFKEISFEIEKITTSAGAMGRALGVKDAVIAADTLRERYVKLLQVLDNLKIRWSAFTKDPQLLGQFDEIRSSIISALDTGDLSTKGWSNLNAQVGTFSANVEGAGKSMKTFLGRMGDNVKKFTQWFLIGGMTATVARSIRDVIGAVKELDSAMVELRKVTDETDATYERFLKNASSRVVGLGTSLSGYVKTVADFSRMGFNIPDSSALADVATMYFNVGDNIGSMDDSVNSIISTMKSFDIQAQGSTKIIDIFNEVGNKFAVTSGDIGAAMQDAGAALATSNNTLEKSVAMWTAMNEILQDGSKASTALRFIAQRMRNTAGELEDMGVDADGAAESVTKLQQQIQKLTGVSIMSSPTEFRDTYDVLQDISKVWGDITDKDQADVIRLMAGTRQASAFSSLMTNWKTAEEALQVALDSTGSAYKENARWLDSIEAKQRQAQAQTQAFSNAILNSSLIKFTYDAGTGILGFLTQLTESLGALPTLAGAAAAALSFKNVG